METVYRPKVDIFMLCYNHAEYVGDAIESILNQTYTDFNFFIVENGSTDNSFEVISKYKDPRIRLFRLEENNCMKATALMVKNQSGEYIANMCSDDYWEPTKLEKQMRYLEQHKEVKACATWAVFVDKDLQPMSGFMDNIFIQPNRSRVGWIRHLLENGNCLSAPSQLAEAGLYKRTISFLYGYWQLNDLDAWMRILQETNIYVVEEVLVKQRIHNKEQSRNISFPGEETSIRTKNESASMLLRVIEDMPDNDFIEMYWDTLKIQKHDLTHIEVLCEKFFVLLSFSEKVDFLEQNVLYFFYKYYGYMEDGVRLSTVMMEEYNYNHQDFTEVSGKIGLSKWITYSRKRENELLVKLRAIIPYEVQEKISAITGELKVYLEYLQNNNMPRGFFSKIVQTLGMVLEEWEWLEFVEISVKKEEIELCMRVCSIYAQNPQIADPKQICMHLDRYCRELETIIGI